jgi:hypothetical protein
VLRRDSDSSNVSAGLCIATHSNSTRNGIQDPLPRTDTGRRVEAKVGDVVRIVWPQSSTFRQRIQTAPKAVPGTEALTVRDFTKSYWKPYLDRKCVKPSTLASYKSALELHILPAFGDCQMSEVVPLQVEQFLQTRLRAGLSPKTTRNLLGILQGLFSLAADNDLIVKSRFATATNRIPWAA